MLCIYGTLQRVKFFKRMKLLPAGNNERILIVIIFIPWSRQGPDNNPHAGSGTNIFTILVILLHTVTNPEDVDRSAGVVGMQKIDEGIHDYFDRSGQGSNANDQLDPQSVSSSSSLFGKCHGSLISAEQLIQPFFLYIPTSLIPRVRLD